MIQPNNSKRSTVIYRGLRDERGCAHVHRITAQGEFPLVCRWDLRNHSPDGFEFGYSGSGPAQLALSMLADAFGPSRAGDQLTLGFYQEFKWRVVSALPQELPWKMTHTRVFLEVRDLVAQDFEYAASRVRHGRDWLVMLDVNARLDEAERRGQDLGDVDRLETQCACRINEEFRQVLTGKARMSQLFCSRLLGVADVDAPQTPRENEGSSTA